MEKMTSEKAGNDLNAQVSLLCNELIGNDMASNEDEAKLLIVDALDSMTMKV